MPTATFQSPTDYQAELASIDRQRRMADMLQQESMQPLGTQSINGWAIPNSPMAYAGKLAQGMVGAMNQGNLDERTRAVTNRYQMEMGDVLRRATSTSNPEEQAAILMQHPATQPIGMQAYQQALQRKRVSELLTNMGYGNPSASPEQALNMESQSGGAPGPTINAAARIGQPNAGSYVNPRAVGLMLGSTNPNVLEDLAKMEQAGFQEANKPVVNRGFGIGTMRNGQYVPDTASLEQALALERGKFNIEMPYKPPVTLKTTKGVEMQLSAPEWRNYQNTQILPARITGAEQSAPDQSTAQQMVGSASALGLPSKVSVNSPGPQLGTIGVSQSQEDQIRQAGEKATAESLGKETGQLGAKIFENGAKSALNLPHLIQMENLASTFEPGKLTPLKQFLGQWAVAAGAMTEQEANRELGNIGSMQALTSMSTRMAAFALRQSDGNPAVKQLELMLEAMPNKGQTPEGFALTMKYMQAAEKMNITKMQQANRYLQEHPNDITGFEAYWSKQLPQMQQQIYGVTPQSKTTVSQPASASPAMLPPDAAKQLTENVNTTFGNGQTWTLKNGQPVRIR